ncbi:X-ray radiation resistance-associated protein 1 [Geranomyces variabilis]|uniref:X-ray radiation resistance-associated protein 1 n=1 Tax=Geranomyces variabilis TaxID=109894 RepID=A0AAD5TDA4_9FUNG|nr:X-ray radiation resistance-associated protein 1 [Geranomyces variabilis]
MQQPAPPRGGGAIRQQVISHPHKLTLDAPPPSINHHDAGAASPSASSRSAAASASRRPGDLTQKRKGKYVEIPQVLDGFFMLNKAPADDPDNVYLLDITGENLCLVIEDDLTMFANLQTLRCGENSLPFAKLGVLPGLRKLAIPCNGLTDLDLEVEGRYLCLEHLDVSYNRLTPAAIIVLASLPSLRSLDLSTNNLTMLPDALVDMTRWRDRVIESLLPKEELDALEGWMTRQEAGEQDTAPAAGPAVASPTAAPWRASLRDFLQADVPMTIVTDDRENGAQAGVPTTGEAVEQLPPHQSSDGLEAHIEQPEGDTSSAAASSEEETPQSTGPRVVSADDELAVLVDSDNEGSVVESAPAEHDGEAETSAPLKDAAVSPTPQRGSTDIAASVGSTAQPKMSAPDPQTVALAQQRTASAFAESHQFTVLPPGWQVPAASPGGPGFRRLEVLTLDNNRINTLAAFKILGALPSLRALTLSRNRIKSLAFLSQQSDATANTENDSIAAPVSKFDGFYQLTDLDLTFNQIRTPDALLGIAALPALAKVFLEGNPIMQRGAQKLAVREDGDAAGEVLGYIEFDPLLQLPAKYHITVADAIYHSVRASSSGPDAARTASASGTSGPAAAATSAATTTPATTISHHARPVRHHHYPPVLPTYHTTTAASRFLSHMRRANAPPPTIAASRFATPRAVADINPQQKDGESGAQRRRRRREYNFTDHDLEEIVRRGYIPDVAELVQFAEERGREADGDDGESDSYYGDEDPGHHSDEAAEYESDSALHSGQLHYDRNAHDETFLTGVHITTAAGDGATSTRSSLQSHPAAADAMYLRTPTPESAVDDDADAPPLPATLPASIRALRAALAACVSRPAALPKGYAAQTQASAAMAAAAAAGRRSAAAGNNKKGSIGAPWSTLGPRSRPPGQLPRIAGRGGGRAGGDEFLQIRRMVNGVNQRIQIVEENLAVLMDPSRPSPLASAGVLLPPSRKLLKRVHDEYARVERMYAAAALAQKNLAPEGAAADAGPSSQITSPTFVTEVGGM